MATTIRVRLLLNEGQEADLYPGEDVAPRIVVQAFDPQKPFDTVGSYTYTIELPKTENNRKLLGNIGNPQLAAAFRNLGKLPALVEADGATVLRGSLFVDRITPNAYECTIAGENIAWAEVFRGIKIRTLDNFRPMRFTGFRTDGFNPWPAQEANSVGLTEAWAQGETGPFDCAFPLLAYGNFRVPDGTTDPNPLVPGIAVEDSVGEFATRLVLNSDTFPLSQFAFRPAVYLRTVVRRLFEYAGFTTSGDFFTDPDTENLVVPFVDSKGAQFRWNWALLGQFASELTTMTITKLVAPLVIPDYEEAAAPFGTVIINKDYSFGRFAQANAFTVPVAGSYTVSISFDFTANPITPSEVQMVVHKNIANDPNQQVNQTVYITVGNSASLTFDVQLEATDTLIFGFFINPLSGIPSPYSVTMDNVLASVTPVSDTQGVAWPFDLDPALALPDVNADVFLKAVVNLFGLFVSVNVPQRLATLSRRARYLLPGGLALDWSGKCTLEEAEVEPILPTAQYLLQMAEQEGDVLLESANFNYTYDNPNVGATGGQTIESLFAATTTRTFLWSEDFGTNPGSPIAIVALYRKTDGDVSLKNISGVDYNYQPRLVKWPGALTGVAVAAGPFVGSTTEGPGIGGTNVFDMLNTLPLCQLADIATFAGTGPTRWGPYFDSLADSYQLRLPVRLLPPDVANADGRVPILIGEQVFQLGKIDGYAPTSDERVWVVLHKK